MPGGGAVPGRRAVFSTPLRRSNRAEKPRRSAKTVCVSAKRRTMRCVSPHVSPQVVEKFCPLVWEMGKRTWACAGVACPALPPAYPAFSLLSYPLSPRPPSPPGKGEIFSFLMQGASPLASPRLNPRGTGSPCQSGTRRVCLRNRQLGAKAIEPPFYWQCRQPRRGGTGGDGTIRRTRRRRLRWSSPPGQVEQMPHGEWSPAPPRRAAPEQGAYRALAEGLALPRLLASPPPSRRGACPHVFLSMP